MTVFLLSVPPSGNKLFANASGRGRVKTSKYRAWIKGELNALIAQRARPVAAPASVSITLPRTVRGDCDNRIKGTVDLLVRAGVLPDDSRKHLTSVSVTFGDVKMMQVEVLPVPAASGNGAV
jgi:crossover junction endodeoxyribonuclease RusA